MRTETHERALCLTLFLPLPLPPLLTAQDTASGLQKNFQNNKKSGEASSFHSLSPSLSAGLLSLLVVPWTSRASHAWAGGSMEQRKSKGRGIGYS